MHLNTFVSNDIFKAVLLLTVYYVIAWFLFGRNRFRYSEIIDLKKPENFSPGSLRYLYMMKFDKFSLIASLISLAEKGFIKIIDDNGEFIIRRTEKSFVPEDLQEDEQIVFDRLFAEKDEAEMSSSSSVLWRKLELSLETYYSKSFDENYFTKNSKLAVLGLVVGVSEMIYLGTAGNSMGMGAVFFAMVVLSAYFKTHLRKYTPSGLDVLNYSKNLKNGFSSYSFYRNAQSFGGNFLAWAVAIGEEKSLNRELSKAGAGYPVPKWYSFRPPFEKEGYMTRKQRDDKLKRCSENFPDYISSAINECLMHSSIRKKPNSNQ